MPKRTTSSGKPQLDCSDGAKMLIDQMKEHPEEFRGYGAKFTNLLDIAREVVLGNPRQMTKRDANAIVVAAETHLYEVWLAEDVLTSIMRPKEEPVQYREAMRLGTNGSLGVSAITASTFASGGFTTSLRDTNTAVTSQYDQAHQRLLAKRDQEALNRQENEHAMRSTKPFKGFP